MPIGPPWGDPTVGAAGIGAGDACTGLACFGLDTGAGACGRALWAGCAWTIAPGCVTAARTTEATAGGGARTGKNLTADFFFATGLGAGGGAISETTWPAALPIAGRSGIGCTPEPGRTKMDSQIEAAAASAASAVWET